jgi:hypothetical protein
LISEEDSAREFAPADLEALIRSPPSRKGLQAPSWLNRISKERAEEFLIDRILDNLSQILSNYNVVQLTVENHLTVEKISHRDECKEAIKNRKREFTFELQKKTLPAFKPWVEFVAKFCGIGVAKLRFEYVAQPEIAAKDVRVTILNDHLSDVSIGFLDVSIEMSMLVNGKLVKLGTISRKLNPKVPHRLDRIAELPKSAVEPAKQPDLSLVAELRFCTKCGTPIARSDHFCRRCGAAKR